MVSFNMMSFNRNRSELSNSCCSDLLWFNQIYRDFFCKNNLLMYFNILVELFSRECFLENASLVCKNYLLHCCHNKHTWESLAIVSKASARIQIVDTDNALQRGWAGSITWGVYHLYADTSESSFGANFYFSSYWRTW